MMHKATIRAGYRRRLAVLGVVTLAIACWFFYDGAIGYPAKRKVQLAYQQVHVEHPQNWDQIWAETSQKNGWPMQPGAPLTHWDIYTQYIIAAICLTFAILFGLGYLRLGQRWISSDEQGLRTSRGQFAPWDALKSVDKARWDKKGIAVVRYEQEGTSGRIVLDDWKYEAEPTVAILKQVDEALGQTTPQTPAPAPLE